MSGPKLDLAAAISRVEARKREIREREAQSAPVGLGADETRELIRCFGLDPGEVEAAIQSIEAMGPALKELLDEGHGPFVAMWLEGLMVGIAAASRQAQTAPCAVLTNTKGDK